MASLLEAVKDQAGMVKTRVTWRYIKTHLTKDKIIVFILIALLWGFSTVPLFIFFLTPGSHETRENLTLDVNKTERDPDCNLTNRVKDCIYENFIFEESTNSCVPNCYTWTSYAPATSTAIDSLVVFCSCIATLTCIAVIAIACSHRKKIFQYPTVLVLYTSISVLLFFAIIFIGYTDRYKFFCSSKNLMTNYISPTSYCIFAGAIIEYISVQPFIWVFFHILSIYFLIFHPLQAKQLLSSSKLKYVHLCVVLVGLLAPLLGPLTTILHSLSDQEDPERLGYRVLIYPPYTCQNARTRILFYTIIFPSNFFLILSVSLLILILWKLLKGRQSEANKIGTAEKKILVTLCFYTLVNITFPAAHVASLLKVEQFEKELLAYFKCASINGVCEPPQAYNAINPAFLVLTWLFRACFPLFLLAYVVDCQRLKKCVMRKRGVALTLHYKSQITTNSQAS